MGWIIFGVVAVCFAIDAWIGTKRGIAFTGVRLILWILGTLAAALTAKGLTGWIIMKAASGFGLKGTVPTEVMSSVILKIGSEDMAEALKAPAAGLAMSALVPVVFVILFIVAKFLTWLLFVIFKKIISNKEAGKAFTERPLWSKIAGGVVGGVAGLMACAIIASPVSGILKTIEDADAADSLFHIMSVTAGGNKVAANIAERAVVSAMLDIENNGIAGLGTVPVIAADATVIGGADGPTSIFLAGTLGGNSIEGLRDLYDSFVNSPAAYVCRYVGAEGVAYAIYRGTSNVKPKDIGATGQATLNYNFPDTVAGVMGIAGDIDNTVTLINDGSGLNTEVIESVEAIVVYALDTDVLADDDKLEILNSSMPVIQKNVGDLLGLGENADFLSKYESFDDFKNDVENIMSLAHVIVESDVIGAGGFNDVDVNALLADQEMLREFVSTAMTISNGPEMIESITNAKVSELSKGKIPEVVSAEGIRNAGEEKMMEVCRELAEMTKFMNKKTITPSEKNEIISQTDAIAATGILTDNAYSTIRVMLEELVE